eukprot:50714-Prorocentrum_minimum.AAC.2
MCAWTDPHPDSGRSGVPKSRTASAREPPPPASGEASGQKSRRSSGVSASKRRGFSASEVRPVQPHLVYAGATANSKHLIGKYLKPGQGQAARCLHLNRTVIGEVKGSSSNTDEATTTPAAT